MHAIERCEIDEKDVAVEAAEVRRELNQAVEMRLAARADAAAKRQVERHEAVVNRFLDRLGDEELLELYWAAGCEALAQAVATVVNRPLRQGPVRRPETYLRKRIGAQNRRA